MNEPNAPTEVALSISTSSSAISIVAAQLEMRALEVPSGQLADCPARRSGAGEGDHPNVGVPDQGFIGVGAAGKCSADPRGDRPPRRSGRARPTTECGARVRLENNCVAERERRRHRSDRQNDRKIERSDHTHHSHRDSARDAQSRLFRTQHLAIRVCGECGCVVALLGGHMSFQPRKERDEGDPGRHDQHLPEHQRSQTSSMAWKTGWWPNARRRASRATRPSGSRWKGSSPTTRLPSRCAPPAPRSAVSGLHGSARQLVGADPVAVQSGLDADRQ